MCTNYYRSTVVVSMSRAALSAVSRPSFTQKASLSASVATPGSARHCSGMASSIANTGQKMSVIVDSWYCSMILPLFLLKKIAQLLGRLTYSGYFGFMYIPYHL